MTLNIGKKISNFRQIHNLTIKEFSEITGISTALISQLERDMGNPTVSILEAIAQALEISLAELVSESIDNKLLVCRRDDRRKIFDANSKHIMYSILADDPVNSNVEMTLIQLLPYTQSAGVSVHAEEEILYLIEGEMEVVFEEDRFLLHEGDTIRILPNRVHELFNNFEQQAIALNVKCKVRY